MTDYNCFLERHGVYGYFKCSNLNFYKVSMTSAENDTFISDLKRSKKNGQSWVFPAEEEIYEVQMDQVLFRNIKASYLASTGPINCMQYRWQNCEGKKTRQY